MVDLAIVGAGPSGLCAAWWAERAGAAVVVLDRGEGPGGAWRNIPADMRCISPRRRDVLAGGHAPPGEGDYATAAEVLASIETLAGELTSAIRYGTEVTGLRPDRKGPHALVTAEETFDARAVLIASGVYERPFCPFSLDPFTGPACHGRHFEPDSVKEGEHVAVIGAGNSGAEAIERLLSRGARVTVSTRGTVSEAHEPPVHGLVAELRWRASGIPGYRLPGRLGCSDRVPLARPSLPRAIAEGRVQVVGATRAVTETGLRLDDGTMVAADRVIACTGYRRDTEFVESLGLAAPDGTPAQRGGRAVGHPRVAFLGLDCMRTRRSGFLRGFSQDARVLVRWLLAR